MQSRKVRQVFVIAVASLVLTGCMEYQADIELDDNGMLAGEIELLIDPESNLALEQLQVFAEDNRPNNWERIEIDEPDKRGVRVSFSDHPLDDRLVLNALSENGSLVLAEFGDGFVFRGESETEQYCQDPQFQQFEDFWNYEIRIGYQGIDVLEDFSFGRYGVEVQNEDSKDLVWRPGFGSDEDIFVLVADSSIPATGGPDDLQISEGCSESPDYSDLQTVVAIEPEEIEPEQSIEETAPEESAEETESDIAPTPSDEPNQEASSTADESDFFTDVPFAVYVALGLLVLAVFWLTIGAAIFFSRKK